jgi:hypothetical protein
MLVFLTFSLFLPFQGNPERLVCAHDNMPAHGTVSKNSLYFFSGDAGSMPRFSVIPRDITGRRGDLGLSAQECDAHCRHHISNQMIWFFHGPERVYSSRLGEYGRWVWPLPALTKKYEHERGAKFGPGAWKHPAKGVAIEFIPISENSLRVFFFVMKKKKIETWETEFAIEKKKNDKGRVIEKTIAVADERNPETIESAFAEDFYVFKSKAEYFFVTQSGKLYISPQPKKGENSRAMRPVWDDAKRPINAIIEDADNDKVWLFAKPKNAEAKLHAFFEMKPDIRAESFDPAKLKRVDVEGRAKMLLEYLPLISAAKKK